MLTENILNSLKKTVPLILGIIILIFTQCKKDKEPCVKNIPEWCNLVDLSSVYDPVCGCDGKTYQNAGHATCVGGVTYTKGKCK